MVPSIIDSASSSPFLLFLFLFLAFPFCLALCSSLSSASPSRRHHPDPRNPRPPRATFYDAAAANAGTDVVFSSFQEYRSVCPNKVRAHICLRDVDQRCGSASPIYYNRIQYSTIQMSIPIQSQSQYKYKYKYALEYTLTKALSTAALRWWKWWSQTVPANQSDLRCINVWILSVPMALLLVQQSRTLHAAAWSYRAHSADVDVSQVVERISAPDLAAVR